MTRHGLITCLAVAGYLWSCLGIASAAHRATHAEAEVCLHAAHGEPDPADHGSQPIPSHTDDCPVCHQLVLASVGLVVAPFVVVAEAINDPGKPRSEPRRFTPGIQLAVQGAQPPPAAISS